MGVKISKSDSLVEAPAELSLDGEDGAVFVDEAGGNGIEEMGQVFRAFLATFQAFFLQGGNVAEHAGSQLTVEPLLIVPDILKKNRKLRLRRHFRTKVFT